MKLSDIIDRPALQSMMQEFYRLTHMGIGIIDIEGNVLVGVGWQDVCTKFFRAHPETCKCCLESDCTLSRGIPAGTYKAYHCKNHLWDLATPIEVDGQHLGNVFLGQFFYDDEVPDEDLFRRMAHQYGFDETAFLAAVASVPRWSRETVDATMTFYTKLAGMISTLSYHKVRMSQVLVEKSATLSELEESRKRLYAILSSIHSGILVVQEEGTLEFVNQAFCELYAISDDPDSLRGMSSADFIRKIEQGFADPVRAVTRIREILQRNELIIGEEVALRGGHIHLRDYVPIVINGKRCGRIWYARDITALKQAEAEAKRSEAALQRQLGLFKSLMENLPVGVFMVEAPSGKPLLANEAALRLLGRGVLPDASRTNLAEVYKASKLSTHEPYPLDELPILRGMNGTSSYVDDMLVERPDGTKTILEVFGSPVRNEQGQVWASLVSFNDISRRRQDEETIRRNEDRLRGLVNILQYRMSTIQEFLDMALNEVIRLTDSKIGYIYFYHEDRRQFVLNTWSKEVMQQCSVVNPQTTYDLDQTGIWGEAVRQRRPIILNDFQAAHPLRKGYPEGHAPLVRFMTVPVFKGDAIVAVVGVANKTSDYDESDVLQLTLLMDSVWKIVDSKKTRKRCARARNVIGSFCRPRWMASGSRISRENCWRSMTPTVR